MSRPWSYPVILKMGRLNWKSSALTTRPLLLWQRYYFQKIRPCHAIHPMDALTLC